MATKKSLKRWYALEKDARTLQIKLFGEGLYTGYATLRRALGENQNLHKPYEITGVFCVDLFEGTREKIELDVLLKEYSANKLHYKDKLRLGIELTESEKIDMENDQDA